MTRIGIGIGLVWVLGSVGGSVGGVLWDRLSSLWGHGVVLFLSLAFFFSVCYWGLRGSEPWGCLWTLFSFYFLFFVDIGTFSEH